MTVLTKTRANKLLRDPCTLVDHVFVLKPGSEEALLWKVMDDLRHEGQQADGVWRSTCEL